MTILALVAVAMGPRMTNDPVVNWVTLPESNMQVELHLFRSGKFEAHEYWTGEQSKPMPNFAMKGRWTKEWDKVILEIQTTYSPFGGIIPQKSKKLPIRSVHLLWMDVLRREHSLTKTSRKLALFDFGPGSRIAPQR